MVDLVSINQKCQYALRALFELAVKNSGEPCKIGAVAEAQGIPVRFLENILNSLKSGGFVASSRGKDGGYVLAKPASDITVGEVIRFVQGPFAPVECAASGSDLCAFSDDCVFHPLGEKARIALEQVYDGTTLADLVDEQKKRAAFCAGCKKNNQ